MARSLPERTIDAYFAIAVAARFRDAALWDPTNTPGMWDHTLIAAGKTVLFESKGNEEGDNDIEIDLEQLDDYLTQHIAPLVFYLFADPPWSDFRAPMAPGTPATRWLDFPDWAYVVPAAALATATGLTGATRTVRPNNGTFAVALNGVPVPCIPLTKFFDELEQCYWVARHPQEGAQLRPGAPSAEYADVPIGGHDVLPAVSNRRQDRESQRRLTAVALHLPL